MHFLTAIINLSKNRLYKSVATNVNQFAYFKSPLVKIPYPALISLKISLAKLKSSFRLYDRKFYHLFCLIKS